MGKVRIESIKRVARNLHNRYPGYFSTVFPENKEKLKGILLTSSKGVRNRVAGYITHLERIKVKQSQGEEGMSADTLEEEEDQSI
jgi:small subunit ribosomal protein S17e